MNRTPAKTTHRIHDPREQNIQFHNNVVHNHVISQNSVTNVPWLQENTVCNNLIRKCTASQTLTISTHLLETSPTIVINMFKGNERCMTSNVKNVNTSACVAAVKCRPVLHHCVVIFFWSLGIMDYILFTFKNRIPLMLGSVRFKLEWHLSFPLMNCFNKIEAAIFPCRFCFLRAFPFISLVKYFIYRHLLLHVLGH